MRFGRYADFERVSLTLGDISAWRKESEYSATYPTGVIPGKRWRRHDGAFDPTCKDPGWLLCEYSEAFIGEDGHECCKVLMKRAVIRAAAITDCMYVLVGKDRSNRAVEPIPSNERDGEARLRLTKHVAAFCMDTFGYEPVRLFSMTYQLLDAHSRHLPPVFILKFRNAKDALVFKMWFE